jgi:23S rRNA (cytosine1962-C5)-methyltransferase
VRAGHPWVFAASIREHNREGRRGELGAIYDRNEKLLALGLYDPQSPIRVRIIHAGPPTLIDRDWFGARLAESLARRAGILDKRTNAARLINGESDRFPALVLDQYDKTLVLKLYSTIWFPWLHQIISLIQDQLNPARLVLRLSRNIQRESAQEKLHDGQILVGPPVDRPVPFLETGLLFEADVLKGQKTGFFLDQRENRRIVESLARGKDVLNAFSFSGGFSLYAARGGARSVTDVDISAHALEGSRRNFARNGSSVGECQHNLVQADVFEWLQARRTKRYDLIVLDPPSLAKRQSDKSAALRAYAKLATAGAGLCRPGATLVCCSCSAHVLAQEFFDTVNVALRKVGRDFKVLRTTREPADHHASFPEAEYLKAIYLALAR